MNLFCTFRATRRVHRTSARVPLVPPSPAPARRYPHFALRGALAPQPPASRAHARVLLA